MYVDMNVACMDPSIFPEEIWTKILMYCDVNDILSCSYTCKYLNKTISADYLWKQKWMQLKAICNFKFPSVHRAQMNHKEMCMRLHTILQSDTVFLRCHYCMEFSCRPHCVEDSGSRVVVDIGNKYTRIVTPNFGLRWHFTTFGVPKVPENSDEDVLDRSRPQEDTDRADVTLSSVPPSRRDMKYEHRPSAPFCLYCSPMKPCREKEQEARHNGRARRPSQHAELLNGFCTDTANSLGIPSIDVVSPAAALLQDSQFLVVREFVSHLLHWMGLVPELQKPNGVLVFCEPLTMSDTQRSHLLHYLFLRIKVTRVCMIAKPLAICAMVGMDTCVVVDSGALVTSVVVIVDGQLVPGRWKRIPVGGWHIAEYLKEALQWQPEECAEVRCGSAVQCSCQIPVSYLDTLTVKEKCRLSYNFAVEERRSCPARRQHINLPVDSIAAHKHFWAVTEQTLLCSLLFCMATHKQAATADRQRVSLGPELYLAPEIMYTSLGLPQAIRDMTDGLPLDVLKECMSHIVLTGGNTDLVGFRARVERDLRDLLPEFSTVLDITMYPGSGSWNVAMGSKYVMTPSTVVPSAFSPVAKSLVCRCCSVGCTV